jgi:hypothetical protein
MDKCSGEGLLKSKNLAFLFEKSNSNTDERMISEQQFDCLRRLKLAITYVACQAYIAARSV